MFSSAEEEMKYTNDFLATNKYPKFKVVNKIIGDDIMMMAEYGEFNHEMLNEIWNNFSDKDLIKRLGHKINNRGGFQAMEQNYYALLAVLRKMLKESKLDNEYKMVIWGCVKIEVSSNWNGVGNWRN